MNELYLYNFLNKLSMLLAIDMLLSSTVSGRYRSHSLEHVRTFHPEMLDIVSQDVV